MVGMDVVGANTILVGISSVVPDKVPVAAMLVGAGVVLVERPDDWEATGVSVPVAVLAVLAVVAVVAVLLTLAVLEGIDPDTETVEPAAGVVILAETDEGTTVPLPDVVVEMVMFPTLIIGGVDAIDEPVRGSEAIGMLDDTSGSLVIDGGMTTVSLEAGTGSLVVALRGMVVTEGEGSSGVLEEGVELAMDGELAGPLVMVPLTGTETEIDTGVGRAVIVEGTMLETMEPTPDVRDGMMPPGVVVSLPSVATGIDVTEVTLVSVGIGVDVTGGRIPEATDETTDGTAERTDGITPPGVVEVEVGEGSGLGLAPVGADPVPVPGGNTPDGAELVVAVESPVGACCVDVGTITIG